MKAAFLIVSVLEQKSIAIAHIIPNRHIISCRKVGIINIFALTTFGLEREIYNSIAFIDFAFSLMDSNLIREAGSVALKLLKKSLRFAESALSLIDAGISDLLWRDNSVTEHVFKLTSLLLWPGLLLTFIFSSPGGSFPASISLISSCIAIIAISFLISIHRGSRSIDRLLALVVSWLTLTTSLLFAFFSIVGCTTWG